MSLKTPNVRIPMPEVLEEHEMLEKAVKAALVITAAGAVHHYVSRNGKGYAYLRPGKLKKFAYEIGLTDFTNGKLSHIRQLFGDVDLPDGDLSRIEESDITITDQTETIGSAEINQAFRDDVADSGY